MLEYMSQPERFADPPARPNLSERFDMSSVLDQCCSVEGCEKKQYRRGFCQPHYRRALKFGTIPKREVLPPAGRFFAKVDKSGPAHPELGTPCWLWTGSLQEHGYGHFRWEGKVRRAHRFAYVAFKGEIPEGLDVDHKCNVRRCVNPDHLQLLTPQENIARRVNAQSKRTHCPRGHLYDLTDRFGYRGCRTCGLEYARKYRAKKR